MKRLIRQVASLLFIGLIAAPVLAGFPWIEGTITDIRINNDGNSNDTVIVYVQVKAGTQGTGCANEAFVLPKTDSYAAQTYSAMLMAKATNTPIKFLHSYCLGAYSRANEYIVLSN